MTKLLDTEPERILLIDYSGSTSEHRNREGPINFIFTEKIEGSRDYKCLKFFLGDVEVGSVVFEWNQSGVEDDK